MSLLSVLKSIGKDLGHVGTWIEDAAKVAAPVATLVDPPLGAIITGVENVLTDLQTASTTPPSAASVQAIVQAVTTIETIKAGAKATPAPASA